MHSTFLSASEERLNWFQSEIEALKDNSFLFSYERSAEIDVKVLDPSRHILFFDLSDNPTEAKFQELRNLASNFSGSIVAVGNAQNSHDVLQSLRSGACDYLDTSKLAEDLSEIWKRLLKSSLEKPSRGKVVLVMSANGGNGKSTIAANLAVAISQSFKISTGLVDFDFDHGDLAGLLHLDPVFNVGDLIRPNVSLDTEMFERSLTPYDKTGVRLLAAPASLVVNAEFSESSILRTVEMCRDKFPVTIIDMPTGHSDLGQRIIDLADIVLVVNRLDFQSIRNTGRFLEFQTSMCRVPANKFQVLINRKGEPYQIDHAKAEEVLHTKLDWELPNDPKAANLAANVGIPVVVDSPNSSLSSGFSQISERLMEKLHLGKKSEQSTNSHRIFNRLPHFITSFMW
jgi:pilus assembly protein CpaE